MPSPANSAGSARLVRLRGPRASSDDKEGSSTTSSSLVSRPDNLPDFVEDSDVTFLRTVNETQLYPHARNNCLEHRFEYDRKDSCNEEHCSKCFCYVCDKPVAECSQWKEHCHVTGQSASGKHLRLCKKNALYCQLTRLVIGREPSTGLPVENDELALYKMRTSVVTRLDRGYRIYKAGTLVNGRLNHTMSVMVGWFHSIVKKTDLDMVDAHLYEKMIMLDAVTETVLRLDCTPTDNSSPDAIWDPTASATYSRMLCSLGTRWINMWAATHDSSVESAQAGLLIEHPELSARYPTSQRYRFLMPPQCLGVELESVDGEVVVKSVHPLGVGAERGLERNDVLAFVDTIKVPVGLETLPRVIFEHMRNSRELYRTMSFQVYRRVSSTVTWTSETGRPSNPFPVLPELRDRGVITGLLQDRLVQYRAISNSEEDYTKTFSCVEKMTVLATSFEGAKMLLMSAYQRCVNSSCLVDTHSSRKSLERVRETDGIILPAVYRVFDIYFHMTPPNETTSNEQKYIERLKVAMALLHDPTVESLNTFFELSHLTRNGSVSRQRESPLRMFFDLCRGAQRRYTYFEEGPGRVKHFMLQRLEVIVGIGTLLQRELEKDRTAPMPQRISPEGQAQARLVLEEVFVAIAAIFKFLERGNDTPQQVSAYAVRASSSLRRTLHFVKRFPYPTFSNDRMDRLKPAVLRYLRTVCTKLLQRRTVCPNGSHVGLSRAVINALKELYNDEDCGENRFMLVQFPQGDIFHLSENTRRLRSSSRRRLS